MPDDNAKFIPPKDAFKKSTPLPGGGDTHVHPHPDGGTVTTRLPGGYEIHDNFDKDGNSTGSS